MSIRLLSCALTRVLAACALLAAAAACGDSIHPAEIYPNTCDEACVIDVFKDLSKVYRPSYGEEGARVWVQQQVSAAIELGVWKPEELSVEMDESVDAANHMIKNVLVRVPGTGRYAGLSPVALQAHLDMIFAVDGAVSGQPLDDYFRSGVDVVEEGGVLHSRNYKTTLGADCGAGVAQMVRYLYDRNLPHPPLELMFTAAEETGLVGAARWDASKLPLSATALINLDGWSTTDLINGDLHSPLAIQLGAAGGVVASVDGKLDGSSVDAGAQLVKLSLSGLLGGHSGFLIGRPRMNAIIAFAALTQEAIKLDAGLRLVSINSGQVSARLGHNKIPSAFEAVLAVSGATSVAELSTALQTFFANYIVPFTDESLGVAKLVVEAVTAGTAPTALTAAATKTFVDTLRTIPNGVIEADPGSLGGWTVSSNIGVLGVNDGTAGKAVFFGYLPRSFVIEKSQLVADQIYAEIQQTGIASLTQARVTAPAWLIDRTATIVTLAKAGAGIDRDMVLPAGTEPGALLGKFPQLKDRVIAIAPAIVEAHTPKEALDTGSFKDATAALQMILVALGEDGAFLR